MDQSSTAQELQIRDLKSLLSKIISPRIINKNEVCDFGMQEHFVDSRPTTQELLLKEKISTLENAVFNIGTLLINNIESS